MLNRRGFIAALAGAFVAPDPERPLWTPGRKLISIPKPGVVTVGWASSLLKPGDIFTIAGVYQVNPLTLDQTHLVRFVVADVSTWESGMPIRRIG